MEPQEAVLAPHPNRAEDGARSLVVRETRESGLRDVRLGPQGWGEPAHRQTLLSPHQKALLGLEAAQKEKAAQLHARPLQS